MTDYTRAQRIFRNRLAEHDAKVEQGLWEIAHDIYQAKAEEIPDWLTISADVRKRSERTIYEYVDAVELKNYIGGDPTKLRLSFYIRASRYLDRLPIEAIRNAIDLAEKDTKMSVDMFTENLANAAKGDTPPVFDVCDVLSELLNRTIKARNKAEVTEDATDLGEVAALLDHKLQRAMRRSASVLDPSGRDDTSDVAE